MMDDIPDDATLLVENDPCSDDWSDTSFLGRLMEDAVFDEEGYSIVEAAIIRSVAEGATFETLGVIIRIIERITLMLKRHVDAGDEYSITNLDDSQVQDLDRRVRFCLVEVSLGNAPDMNRADY